MRQFYLLSVSALLARAPLAAAQAQSWKDSDLHQTLLPTTAPPDDPEDSYRCVFSNASQYFDPPQPTEALKLAFWDYGDELIASCVDSGENVEDCWPGKKQWCDLTTKAPATLTSALSAWGSSATSWWSDHSSDAVDVATKCPQNWFNAMMDLAVNRQWLNLTIAWAACDEDQIEPISTGQGPTSTFAAPGSTGQNQRAAATDLPGGSGRLDDKWKIAGGGGVAAAIANAAL